MTHMLIEDGLQSEIEAARMDLVRDQMDATKDTAELMAAMRKRVVDAFPPFPDERRMLVSVIAVLTLSLEADHG